MTNEETASYFEEIIKGAELLDVSYVGFVKVDAIRTAFKALQKQAPLTPTRKSVCSGWVQAMCPACNNVVYDSERSDAFNAARHREWCIKCGQHFTMPAKMIGVWAKMEVDE